MVKRIVISLALMAVLAIPLAACGVGPDQSREDAGDAPATAVDKTQPRVTAFNNHYPNVETKCANGAPGFRLFVQTHDSAAGRNVQIERDENCR